MRFSSSGGLFGPLLRKSGSPTKIWVLDHNFNLWDAPSRS